MGKLDRGAGLEGILQGREVLLGLSAVEVSVERVVLLCAAATD